MFWYFGYGSNIGLTSLRAKGVEPRESQRAVLHGWRLRFNVRHFFRHEGGVGNIERSADVSDLVRGVVHLCEDEHLALLDAAEACGHGYERIEVLLQTERGERLATAYVGMPAFLDERCRPAQRYLNILVKGATAAGLDPAYIQALRRHPVHPKQIVAPFAPPPGMYPSFDEEALARSPQHTALAGFVFDMSDARAQHDFLRGFFGGKDMTLFHLKRADHSDGSETLDDIRHGRLSPAQRAYLNEYLHEYAAEYVYAGRYIDPQTPGAPMDELAPALPHGEIEEVFPGVFFVTGTMKTELMNSHWHFSRNMTVVRDGSALTLINSVRLDDAGLAQLDALGRVMNVVKIGALHGRDDAFYKARYGATLWALPGMAHEHGLVADKALGAGADMPFTGCSVFDFRTTKLPECILHIDRAGGILVACDSLQNWLAPDAFFSDESRKTMTDMGFFQPANIGPLWMQVNEPKVADFDRLRELPFRHVLCGHGSPLRDTAKEAYSARIERVFGAAAPA